MAVQWGDVAAWVSSGGTSVALILTYRLLRATRREQSNLRREQQQSQARKVSAWCERVDLAVTAGPGADPAPDRVVVRLQNASDEPIYDVRVAVGTTWWDEPIEYVKADVSYVVGPHYSQPHDVDIHLDRVTGPELSPPVEIIFSDATGGKFWRRDRYGGLIEITAGLPPISADHFFKKPTNIL